MVSAVVVEKGRGTVAQNKQFPSEFALQVMRGANISAENFKSFII